jgi:hypothetical protein
MASAPFRGNLAKIFRDTDSASKSRVAARRQHQTEEDPMATIRLLGVVTLTSILALPLVGCSSSGGLKISSQKLCEAAGGQYSGHTCNPGSTKSAADMCAAHGGIYLDGEDTCRMPVGNL